ncbi:MAG TPA: chemotaxis protein CheD [Coriobacteriia bacterium]
MIWAADISGAGAKRRNVGIAEFVVSDDVEETLVTCSLGSCVGVVLYDPQLHLAGLVHCMLPLSQMNRARALENPGVFTDTGVATLMQEMFNRGSRRERIVAKVAGAASALDDGGLFRIGERNYAVLRRILWKNGVLIAAEDVGGTETRTLSVEVGTGRVLVRSGSLSMEL